MPRLPRPGSAPARAAGTPPKAPRPYDDYPPPVGDVARMLGDYVVMDAVSVVVTALWVAAAYLIDCWDRFPHLTVTSPEMRCGKTTMLEVLASVVPRPEYTASISPAALYRLIEKERPTLLVDESQSLVRRGSEMSEVIREILNAGIGKDAKVIRCGGERYEDVHRFSVYSPKVFAAIGALDGILADRCVTVELRRKTGGDVVLHYRSREVGPRGAAVAAALAKWAGSAARRATAAYDRTEHLPCRNDRMSDMLLPLQAVAAVACRAADPDLRAYAARVDERDRREENQSPGVKLLTAVRELFSLGTRAAPRGREFISTMDLLTELINRPEEPWGSWDHGRPITTERLAGLLRQYGIRTSRNRAQTARGYFAADFKDAFGRYLPPPPTPPGNTPNPTTAVNPAGSDATRFVNELKAQLAKEKPA